MYWILTVVMGSFLFLLFLARKERPPEKTSVLMSPFYKTAQYLYKHISTCLPRLFLSLRVETDLTQLYPTEPRELLKTDYYVRKIALCLALSVTGTLLGGAVHLGVEGEVILGEDGRVPRGSFRQGSTEVTVAADLNGQKMIIRVPVEFQKLTYEETESLCGELLEKIPALILKDNENLQNVTADLNLQERYEGYPFLIRWDSNKPWVVSASGAVSAEEQPQQATLSARLFYEDFESCAEFDVTVRLPEASEEEKMRAELEKLVFTAEENSREEVSFTLPEQWRGERIVWRQIVEDNSFLLWLIVMALSAAVYFLFDRDLHGQLERRRKALKRAYPELVHKLVLFVGAGMTLRGALQKMAGDYEERRREGADESLAYEELLYTCRELRSGVSEGAAYEHFGRRTGMQEYIRLSTLLAQNLKRGNSSLLERLREEADKVSEERLQQSRKLGEEAGIKLLAPMVLLLAVMMVMIMLPAFSSM